MSQSGMIQTDIVTVRSGTDRDCHSQDWGRQRLSQSGMTRTEIVTIRNDTDRYCHNQERDTRECHNQEGDRWRLSPTNINKRDSYSVTTTAIILRKLIDVASANRKYSACAAGFNRRRQWRHNSCGAGMPAQRGTAWDNHYRFVPRPKTKDCDVLLSHGAGKAWLSGAKSSVNDLKTGSVAPRRTAHAWLRADSVAGCLWCVVRVAYWQRQYWLCWHGFHRLFSEILITGNEWRLIQFSVCFIVR